MSGLRCRDHHERGVVLELRAAMLLDGCDELRVESFRSEVHIFGGDVRQAANCGLYIATSKSATTEATVTLGLNRPK